MKTLVVGPSWIGDAVLSHPLLVRLAARDPHGSIEVLALPSVLPVYSRMREVARTMALPFGHGALDLAGRRRFAKALGRYDRAIVLPNTLKSALIPWHAGIPVRTGYRGEMRFGLVNDRRTLDAEALPLIAERYAALAQPAGETLERPIPEPRLVIDPQSRAAAIAKHGLDTSKPVAVLAPGAEYGPAKRWPVRHFADLAKSLISRGEDVWLMGSAKDAAITADIQALTGNACVDLAGKTTLDEAIDLMSLGTHVVSNDSGLMHVAAALERPMAAIFGSSSPAFTPPLSSKARVVTLKLECSPCFARECPLGHTNCLVQLEASRVLAALED